MSSQGPKYLDTGGCTCNFDNNDGIFSFECYEPNAGEVNNPLSSEYGGKEYTSYGTMGNAAGSQVCNGIQDTSRGLYYSKFCTCKFASYIASQSPVKSTSLATQHTIAMGTTASLALLQTSRATNAVMVSSSAVSMSTQTSILSAFTAPSGQSTAPVVNQQTTTTSASILVPTPTNSISGLPIQSSVTSISAVLTVSNTLPRATATSGAYRTGAPQFYFWVSLLINHASASMTILRTSVHHMLQQGQDTFLY